MERLRWLLTNPWLWLAVVLAVFYTVMAWVSGGDPAWMWVSGFAFGALSRTLWRLLTPDAPAEPISETVIAMDQWPGTVASLEAWCDTCDWYAASDAAPMDLAPHVEASMTAAHRSERPECSGHVVVRWDAEAAS